jgi:hypothetical protein
LPELHFWLSLAYLWKTTQQLGAKLLVMGGAAEYMKRRLLPLTGLRLKKSSSIFKLSESPGAGLNFKMRKIKLKLRLSLG